MRFYRITRAAYATAATAFAGLGAIKAAHRWNWAALDLRAIYCSESLALACLETLVHMRPLPRSFPASVFYSLDIPDEHLERPGLAALPRDWNAPVPPSSTRDFGTAFLREQRAAALLLPTAVVPVGFNVLVNPLHPDFRLRWAKGPFPFVYDGRLA